MATVGVAARQRVRISVYHQTETGIVMPCDFQAMLIGVDGKTLASAKGTVIPGQGAVVDFDPAAGLGRGERIQVHGNVVILGSFPGDDPAHHAPFVGATLELFDAHSGITRSLIEPWIVDDPTLEQ